MYLSDLRVNGFKSFADQTHLRFERGVTAVVGPNGCGKSNIADAIRWVLGEQSAKALRGGKMQDVIFEGSDRRKPLNLCEVAITLTDCEKELGGDFNEVEIARRVHRDGGSNYYLNGKACRLKDIQRLFMDTGIGRTSYSIMAQGQIDQILSSKPEERRAVFEEAAGISKYKAQRREALNKLALVETNLNRVTDVIGEIGRQIGSLKRQATKAIRYKKVSHKLRHLDVGYSAHQFKTLSSSLQHIDKSSGSLQGEVEEAAKALEERDATLLSMKEKRQALIQRVQDAQQSVFDLRSMKEQAANVADMANIKIASMSERGEQARHEIAAFEAQIGEIAGRLDAHSADKQMHMDVLGNSDEIFQERNADLAQVESGLEAAEREIQQIKVRAADAERAAQRCREELSRFEVESGTSHNRLMRLEEELEEQGESHADAAKALSEFSEKLTAARSRLEGLQADLETAREQVSSKRDAFKAAQVRIQEVDRAVAQKTARLKLLQQLQEKLEGYGEGAKALLKGRMLGPLEGKAFVPLAADLSVIDGYGSAIEALLGTAVEAVCASDADTVSEIFKQLEERKVGRVCLQLQTSPAPECEVGDRPEWLRPALDCVELRGDSGHDSLRAALACSFIVDDMASFLKWREANPAFRFLHVASTKGETMDARGLVTGGFKNAKNSSILQREIELKQTQKELDRDQQSLTEARALAEGVNRELESAEEAVEARRHEIGETSREISSLQTEERNAERALQELKQRSERLERERESLTEAQAAAAEKVETARAKLGAELERQESFRRQLEELEQGIGALRSERDEKREALSQAKYDLQEKKQKLDALNQGLVEMGQRRNELTRLIESKTRDIDNWESQIESLQDEIAQAAERGESVESELEEAKALVTATRDSLIEIEGQIEALEKAQGELRGKVDSLKGSLTSQQVQIAEKRSRLEFIQEEITREYGVDLRQIDWQYELWKARQPVENLPKLDPGDEEDSEDDSAAAVSAASSAEPEDEQPEAAAASAPNPDAVSNVDADAVDAEAQATATEPLSKPAGPTEEERLELEATNWTAIKREIENLRKRIQGMGTVNTDAIAEYGELRERHDFLKAQYDDLTASRDKLVAAIDEINTMSRAQFSDTFDKIRENFKHTFTTLFHGGKADLQLIETDDVLESGIEIVAQPPGTKLKGVSLLSGGQKTMTAVGLLFAIYMVKPSPFCLLDELDAPLDESNIGRFTALLRQFTQQSQFIIITHNKRTIAAAQAIYGVTMEEKGVSKVVSMKFHSEHENQDLVTLELDEPVATGAA